MFNDVYRDKRVFVTGHTGFKGSWLILWLQDLGAEIAGYSLEPENNPCHYEILGLELKSTFDDIRYSENVSNAIQSFRPDIVFHLAAQSLVRRSYRYPIETFETNVLGTVNILDACRLTDSVRAVVNVTSDKCYENNEWALGYRETDPMGGHDPYSASKGCAELVTASYRRSFFPVSDYDRTHRVLVASARAGNVLGGGDWGEDRLIPDIMRASNNNQKAVIRSPKSVRPWQYVLEPLSGYLLLGQLLFEKNKNASGAWNFGPDSEDHRDVESVALALRKHWEAVDFRIDSGGRHPYEAGFLKLDCSKANTELGWKPIWDCDAAIRQTAKWYSEFYGSGRALSREHLGEYINDAKQKKMSWAMR